MHTHGKDAIGRKFVTIGCNTCDHTWNSVAYVPKATYFSLTKSLTDTLRRRGWLVGETVVCPACQAEAELAPPAST